MKNTEIKYSFAQWCKDNDHQDWLDRWDYELNVISPDEVAYKSGNKYWFKCPREIHESELKKICNLTEKQCLLFCTKCRSFGQWLIDNMGYDAIEKYWSDKNIIDPFSITFQAHKCIWIKCTDHTHPDYSTKPYVFSSMNCRCPVCVNKKVIPGINDIATTRKDLVKYFLHQEDANKYSEMSGKSVEMQCDLCGTVQTKRIATVSTRGFHCSACSDGISYPNKFIYNFLSQLKKLYKLTFEKEKIFAWSKDIEDVGTRRYDFYIHNYDIIIEAHGEQHYEESFGLIKGAKTLLEEQQNDEFKYNLAMSNNIKHGNYIVLNCIKSDVDWIRRSIMNSSLPELLNFSEDDICWSDCDKFASSNMIKVVCDTWNSGIHNVKEIASIVNLYYGTVTTYLQKGAKFGWTTYGESKNRPLLCLDNSYVFYNAKTCVKFSQQLFGVLLQQLRINASARTNGKVHTQGYHFTYLTKEQYANIRQIEPWRVYE